MQNSSVARNPRWLNQCNVTWTAIVLFLGANVVLCGFQIVYAPFDPDELQHAHIAWLIANGNIPYKDFWEHHGPLFGFLNGAIFYLADAGRSMNIMFGLRALSAAISVGILAVVYAMARTLSLSPKAGLTAVAMLSSLIYFQDNGMEMRPDALQNLLWLAGMLLVLRNVSRRLFRVTFLAGIFFGLAMLTNIKAGFGPMFLVLFYIVGRRCRFQDLLFSSSTTPAAALLRVAGHFYRLRLFYEGITGVLLAPVSVFFYDVYLRSDDFPSR